jgi:hypothetical protein
MLPRAHHRRPPQADRALLPRDGGLGFSNQVFGTEYQKPWPEATTRRLLPGRLVQAEGIICASGSRRAAAHAPLRDKAGLYNVRIYRDTDSPDKVLVWSETQDVAKAREAVSSPDIQNVMKEAGVIGPPKINVIP